MLSIHKLALQQEYGSIFDHLFLANGGWTQILKTSSACWFDSKVATQRDRVKAVANIIDFSYRFWTNRPEVESSGRRKLGGVETAKHVVERTSGISDSTIKIRWSMYNSAAIFLYLILIQKFDLQPPELSSAEFVDKLLQQTDNIGELQKCFCAYQSVRTVLSNLNYDHFPPLNLDLGCSAPDLSVTPFSQEIIDAYSDWAKHVR